MLFDTVNDLFVVSVATSDAVDLFSLEPMIVIILIILIAIGFLVKLEVRLKYHLLLLLLRIMQLATMMQELPFSCFQTVRSSMNNK